MEKKMRENEPKENKEDLRVFKTKRAIREAFLALRRTTDLEKIKVRDICRLAYINPTTFYNHYTDVPDLSDRLENEVLGEIFAAFDGKDALFDDPLGFLKDAPVGIEAEDDVLSVLFRGRQDVKFAKLERLLREYYSGGAREPAEDITMTFIISGVMHTMYLLRSEQKYSAKELETQLAACIQKLLS